MQNAYYRDFYDKAMITAGSEDRKAFMEIEPDLVRSHLLIGLQGHPKKETDYYQWSVLVYVTDSTGYVNGTAPIYASSLYDRFDDAIEAARTIEKEIREDRLHTVLLEEKIS